MLSKLLRDPSQQDVKIAKSPRCQESKGSPRDPKALEILAIQVTRSSKSFPKKSTLLEVELFLIIAFP